jgi:hypothetical protein
MRHIPKSIKRQEICFICFSSFLAAFNIFAEKKASKGHKTPSEAFISASSGNPLSWYSPRKLRVKRN